MYKPGDVVPDLDMSTPEREAETSALRTRYYMERSAYRTRKAEEERIAQLRASSPNKRGMGLKEFACYLGTLFVKAVIAYVVVVGAIFLIVMCFGTRENAHEIRKATNEFNRHPPRHHVEVTEQYRY